MKYLASGYASAGTRRISTEITQSYFDQINSSRYVRLFGLGLEEKISLMMDNYFEFEAELLTIAQKAAIWSNRSHEESMTQRLALDRRVVNVLTACRLYLDQTAHGISDIFGKDSPQLEDVKAYKGRLYDGHKGYRLMEAMRNHVQHAGLLIHVIQYSLSSVDGMASPHSQITIIPQCEVNQFLGSRSFKAAVFSELKADGEKSDLRPLIREYVSCLLALHAKIREVTDAKIHAAKRVFESATAEHAKIEGDEVQFPSLRKVSENEETEEEIFLNTRVDDYYEELRQKNRFPASLTRLSASNALPKTNKRTSLSKLTERAGKLELAPKQVLELDTSDLPRPNASPATNS